MAKDGIVMKVKEYIDNEGYRYDKFAEKLGMSRSMIHSVVILGRPLQLEYWKKIIEITNGKITLQDLFNEEYEKRMRKKNKI